MTVDLYAVVVDNEIKAVHLYSQGVQYQPMGKTTVNGVQKFTFDLPVIKDNTTVVWHVAVEDSVRTGEKLGG
jgi:hypothetical protein